MLSEDKADSTVCGIWNQKQKNSDTDTGQ